MRTERSTSFLMANLGSELTRFFALQKQGDRQNAEASANRSYDIILKLSAREDIGGGKREIEILKDIIKDALSDEQKYHITEAELNTYFIPFAERVLLTR